MNTVDSLFKSITYWEIFGNAQMQSFFTYKIFPKSFITFNIMSKLKSQIQNQGEKSEEKKEDKIQARESKFKGLIQN